MAVQIIESLVFAEVRDVLQFDKMPENQVVVAVRTWKDLPIHPASGEMTFTSRTDAPGISYNISVSARLKESKGISDECIFKVKLCSGKELIIGSPFIPVIPLQNSSISLTSIQISHLSTCPPLELITPS